MQDYKYYNYSRISNQKSEVFFSTSIPLAGEFLTKEQIGQEKLYPLTLSFCPISSSVQVNEVINAEKLFKNYFYKTGSIKTLVDHFQEASNLIKQKFSYTKIMDIGCNDFTFLKNFIGNSDIILGVDPSDISKKYQPTDCSLENSFFNFQQSEKLKDKYGKFDLIFSSNNFAHIEDLQDYTQGISNLLSENGTFVCEVHWVGSMLQQMQFPFIYHEHMYYHTLKAIIYLLNKYGLTVNDVEQINTHGGSIRFFASKNNFCSSNVEEFLKHEEEIGLYDINTYFEFASKIQALKNESRRKFDEHKRLGHKVYGYGASGQANTLMNIFGITKDDLEYIIDDSPIKNNLYTPINNIQIKDSSFLNENPPDYIHVLAYTFLKEIKEKNKHLNCKWETAI